MSSSFFYTPKGYLNLNSVEIARFKKGSSRAEIISNGTVVDDNSVNFGSTVISIIPTTGEWELLTICENEDGTDGIWVEPILAWGLTALGHTVPITPSEMSGVPNEAYSLRKVGSPLVYVSGDRTYPTTEDWFAGNSAKAEKQS